MVLTLFDILFMFDSKKHGKGTIDSNRSIWYSREEEVKRAVNC